MATVHDIQERLKCMYSQLVFDPVKHLYYLDGQNLISVSKKVETHAPKFDPDKKLKGGYTLIEASARKASKLEGTNITSHELRHRWQTINKAACDLGHETHDFMERYTGIETPRTPQEVAGVKFFTDMSKDYEVVFREIRMFSREFEYAGTEDLILIHKQTGSIITADYKTNGDLWKSYDFLFPPFDSMDDSPYNKYQIQLGYYQIMLEEHGFMVDERWLVYLMADGTYKTYKLNDFTGILKQMMYQQKQVA